MISILLSVHRHLLRAFPAAFRDEFAAEMRVVFRALLWDAQRQGVGAVARVAWRELVGMPPALLRAHGSELQVRALREGRSPLECLLLPQIDLHRLQHDGRYSRLQAVLEVTPFLMAGAVLTTVTYTALGADHSGPHRYLHYLRFVSIPLALPVALLGFTRGLPRWAYPWLGFLLSYGILTVYRHNLLWFAGILLLAMLFLLFAAAMIHARGCPLPGFLQWAGRSLQVDWTRVSFAVHGALPLVILMAFDDGFVNNRTVWLALSLLLIVAGATLYSRSERQSVQLGILIASASLALFCSLLNQAHFRGGLQSLATARSWSQSMSWQIQLWSTVILLLLAPRFAGPVLARVSGIRAGSR